MFVSPCHTYFTCQLPEKFQGHNDQARPQLQNETPPTAQESDYRIHSLSWITGAARSIACETAGTRSGSVSPARSCSSSPQCDMKSPLCNGSEHIASWITRHDRFWMTGETRGGGPRNRGGGAQKSLKRQSQGLPKNLSKTSEKQAAAKPMMSRTSEAIREKHKSSYFVVMVPRQTC